MSKLFHHLGVPAWLHDRLPSPARPGVSFRDRDKDRGSAIVVTPRPVSPACRASASIAALASTPSHGRSPEPAPLIIPIALYPIFLPAPEECARASPQPPRRHGRCPQQSRRCRRPVSARPDQMYALLSSPLLFSSLLFSSCRLSQAPANRPQSRSLRSTSPMAATARC